MKALIDFPSANGTRLRGKFASPREILSACHVGEIVPVIDAAQAHSSCGRWAVGMVAYEAARAFDPAFKTTPPASGLPLAAFAIFDDIAEFSASPPSSNGFSCSVWEHNTPYADFERTVKAIREQIAAGDYYQTNFTARLTADFGGDAEAFFHSLCAAQPSNYALFLDFGPWQIASVSPELFFAWNPNTGQLKTCPMKGTAPLEQGAQALRLSEKDCSENLMIVDLLRNDISRISGNVSVSDLYSVQALPTVLQMTSTVTGTTRPKTSLSDVFGALFPCGSITGAPKIAAMAAIAAYEHSPRGAYCGALGVLKPGGEAIFNVGIRTVTIANSKATCGIGSGITWDSQSQDEFAEGHVKQRFLWRASANFCLLESLRLEFGTYWVLDRHIDRMRRSATHFGFVFDDVGVRQTLDRVASSNPQGVFRVRLMADRRGAISTQAFAFERYMVAAKTMRFPPADEAPKFVALASRAISSDHEFLRHKTTHRAVYDAFAPKDPEQFDTLLFNERGEVTEFSRGNVVVEIGGKRITPAEECGLLPGTLRAELLAKMEISEQVLTIEDVRRATALWFINGLRGIIPVRLKD